MKCAQHIEQSAVGTCNDCGKGLCPECIAIFTPPLCSGCALAHNQEVAKTLWIQLALMGGLFVAALATLLGKVPFATAIGYALMAGFFPSGWKFLGRFFSPSGGYFFATARWINLVFHVATALALGVIVGPIYLYKAWKELQIVKNTKEQHGSH